MKKSISLLAAICVLTSVTVVSAKDLTKEQQTVLYSYGIMVGDQNGDLRLNDNVTRAETIKMICCANGININSDVNHINDKFFNDVSDNHWAVKYISYAKTIGIIDCCEYDSFGPEDQITYNEIIKMIVSVLGYSPMADSKGGYPNGYAMIASQLGITKSLSINNESFVSRNDAAILISNALNIPIMLQTGINLGVEQSNTEYQIANGENGTKLITLRSLLDENK